MVVEACQLLGCSPQAKALVNHVVSADRLANPQRRLRVASMSAIAAGRDDVDLSIWSYDEESRNGRSAPRDNPAFAGPAHHNGPGVLVTRQLRMAAASGRGET